jgi:hypothetical protein
MHDARHPPSLVVPSVVVPSVGMAPPGRPLAVRLGNWELAEDRPGEPG